MKKSFNFLRFQKAIMSSLETTLYIVLALYFLIKILVELLARLDRIMELLSAIFFNTCQPPPVSNNNNNGVNNINVTRVRGPTLAQKKAKVHNVSWSVLL